MIIGTLFIITALLIRFRPRVAAAISDLAGSLTRRQRRHATA
jgi:hypothetical protein